MQSKRRTFISETLRAVAVIGLATATIGSTVAAKGLGEVIVAGLLSNNLAFIVQGGVITGVLAVLISDGFQAVARPGFGMTKGGGEIPWYVFELPVIVIGCQQPTILADIPQARTYINTYDSAPATLDVLVDELMAGPEAFKGKDPIDSFCGMWDTHL